MSEVLMRFEVTASATVTKAPAADNNADTGTEEKE